ncbi:hypothetical protein JTE90_020692 [Oedothorax gibbosus]|uniref:BTB domain-containing protein n=1 Tax=Oedothorax gibbosus TaxID=931172 RepID=A0AAV6V414_9ARAC|nr:hypothetical protein JTE90_020692 [Oedothorax gibbosus]
MSEVQKVGNEIDGCQVQTTFVKRTYVFGWSVKNFPPNPSIFVVRSPEFRPVSDRLFYATVERKYESAYGYHDVILSIFLKEGLPIEIKHAISITNCAGKILRSESGTHKHSLVGGCLPAFNAKFFEESTVFKIEDYQCINFRCTMEFAEFSTDLLYSYQLPSSTISLPTLVDDLKAMFAKSLHADLFLKVKKGVVRVHKALLCARSPVFTKMFEAPMDEKKNH